MCADQSLRTFFLLGHSWLLLHIRYNPSKPFYGVLCLVRLSELLISNSEKYQIHCFLKSKIFLSRWNGHKWPSTYDYLQCVCTSFSGHTQTSYQCTCTYLVLWYCSQRLEIWGLSKLTQVFVWNIAVLLAHTLASLFSQMSILSIIKWTWLGLQQTCLIICKIMQLAPGPWWTEK